MDIATAAKFQCPVFEITCPVFEIPVFEITRPVFEITRARTSVVSAANRRAPARNGEIDFAAGGRG
jgi:hypothetical protein